MAHTLPNPNGASGATSPLQAFRDAARGAMQYLQGLGVDLTDGASFNNQVAEHDFAAEVSRLFDDSDANTLARLTEFVMEHATDDESGGNVAAMGRASQHPYEREVDRIMSSRGLSRLAAVRAAREENPQTFAAYRKSRMVTKRDGGDATPVTRGARQHGVSQHNYVKHAYEQKIDAIVAAKGVTKLVAMREARATLPALFASYRNSRRVGKAS